MTNDELTKLRYEEARIEVAALLVEGLGGGHVDRRHGAQVHREQTGKQFLQGKSRGGFADAFGYVPKDDNSPKTMKDLFEKAQKNAADNKAKSDEKKAEEEKREPK